MRDRNIFCELAETIKEIKAKKKDISEMEENELKLINHQLELLMEIQEYINSLVWLTKKDTKERVKYYIDTLHYPDYRDRFDISKGAAKESISYASKKAKQKIGESTIKLILEGRISSAKYTFYICSGKIIRESLFDEVIIEQLPKAKHKTVSINECINELKFIKLYSKVMQETRFQMVDSENLAFIMYLLESDNPKYAELKPELIDLLLNEKKTVKVFLENAKSLGIY